MAFLGEIGFAFQLILQRVLDLINQAISNRETLWILLPLVVTFFLIELYFRRYRRETLGWESAVGNSLVLFFVAITLFSYLDRNNLLFGVSSLSSEIFPIALTKSIITFFILLESILLILLDFFHLMPKKIAFGISSSMIINIISIMCVLLVYSELPLDIVTILAILFLIAVLILVLNLISPLVPEKKIKEPPPAPPIKISAKTKNKFK